MPYDPSRSRAARVASPRVRCNFSSIGTAYLSKHKMAESTERHAESLGHLIGRVRTHLVDFLTNLDRGSRSAHLRKYGFVVGDEVPGCQRCKARGYVEAFSARVIFFAPSAFSTKAEFQERHRVVLMLGAIPANWFATVLEGSPGTAPAST
jgi:hypothetical protein